MPIQAGLPAEGEKVKNLDAKKRPLVVGPEEPTAKQAAQYSQKDPHAESEFSFVKNLDGTLTRKTARSNGNFPRPSN